MQEYKEYKEFKSSGVQEFGSSGARLEWTGWNAWNVSEERFVMKAVQIKSYGDPVEVLEVVDVPEPEAPGVNETLIGIELAALTKYDLLSVSKDLGGGAALRRLWAPKGSGVSSPSVATSRMSRLAIAC